MSYAILRTEKLKTFDKLKAVNGHHFRTHYVKNADAKKTPDNIRLIDCSDDLIGAVKNRIGDRKIRKNGVIAVEVLLTASPDFFRENAADYGVYDRDTVNRFNDRAVSFLKREFGDENVVSAICHLDEATPHIQAVIVPIDYEKDKNGRLNAARWLDGKKRLSELQDRFSEYVHDLGLERGIKGSQSKHTTIQQYYGALESAEVVSLPAPQVATPPAAVRESSRQRWAADESERINSAQRPVIEHIETKAATASLAKKREREAEKTARKKSEELERMKREAALVRDIDLRDVIEKMQAKTITKGRVYEINGEQISINGSKFFNHYQNVGGGGAIDLVMHVEGLDFKKAIAWLGGNISKDAAVGAAMHKAKTDATEAVKAPAPMPEPVEQHWPQVRKYLIEKRGFAEKEVDWMHKQDLVFADFMQNACFRYGSKGVEKVGTRDKKWRGFVGSKSAGFSVKSNSAAEGVIFVESAIDAISLSKLIVSDARFHKYRSFDVVSVAGTSTDIAAMVSAKRQYNSVICAFDADARGNEAFESMRQSRDDIERLTPEQPHKDWNDYIKPVVSSGDGNKDEERLSDDHGMRM